MVEDRTIKMNISFYENILTNMAVYEVEMFPLVTTVNPFNNFMKKQQRLAN